MIFNQRTLYFRGLNTLNDFQAFPAGSGLMDRTTYMFTYVDPQPGSPKLEELLEDYWNLMPNYQVIFNLVIHIEIVILLVSFSV